MHDVVPVSASFGAKGLGQNEPKEPDPGISLGLSLPKPRGPSAKWPVVMGEAGPPLPLRVSYLASKFSSKRSNTGGAQHSGCSKGAVAKVYSQLGLKCHATGRTSTQRKPASDQISDCD